MFVSIWCEQCMVVQIVQTPELVRVKHVQTGSFRYQSALDLHKIDRGSRSRELTLYVNSSFSDSCTLHLQQNHLRHLT